MISRNYKIQDHVSCFLLGPRGTGKTTWLRSSYPNAVYLDLLEARLYNLLAADPQRLGDLIPPGGAEPVILDEIQKLPALLDEVHRLMETRNVWFILTGSSDRKLRRSGVNLLGGRAVTRHFPPLTAYELGEDFQLEKALNSGMLPTLYDDRRTITPEAYLSAYVQTYLREEVQQEGLTRNVGNFARFLEAASFSQAQVLNLSSVARECQVQRKVVEGYFTILEDLLLAVRLPVFQKRAQRAVTQHPKFFFFDTGVFRALRPRGPLDPVAEMEGPALETLLLQHLHAYLAQENSRNSLFYWRTKNGMEVDLVLYGEKRFIAFEVKRSHRVERSDLKGLLTFRAEYPEARLMFLYGGSHTLYMDGVEIHPMRDVLKCPELLLGSE